MSNGQTTPPNQPNGTRRNTDKYLSYLRELGAMAILAMVLYGVWDIFKAEGKLAIAAIIENTSAIESLKDVNDDILDHLKKLEVKGNVYRSNLGAYGPHYYGRDSRDDE
jgi:hypothetical protein